MPKVTFNLKEPNCKKETLMFLIYRFNSYKLKYSTGQRVLPQHWISEKQHIRESKNFRQHETINLLLDQIEAAAGGCYRKLICRINKKRYNI